MRTKSLSSQVSTHSLGRHLWRSDSLGLNTHRRSNSGQTVASEAAVVRSAAGICLVPRCKWAECLGVKELEDQAKATFFYRKQTKFIHSAIRPLIAWRWYTPRPLWTASVEYFLGNGGPGGRGR